VLTFKIHLVRDTEGYYVDLHLKWCNRHIFYVIVHTKGVMQVDLPNGKYLVVGMRTGRPRDVLYYGSWPQFTG